MSAASFLGISGLIALAGYDGFLYSIGFLVAWLLALLLIAELLRNSGRFTMADQLAFRMRQRPVRTAAATSKKKEEKILGFGHLLVDAQHHAGKDLHPVDVIAKAMEGEGIKLLLSMLHKADLKGICDHCGINITVESTRKSEMIKIIRSTWVEVGTKKFLKKKVSDTTLTLFCKYLNIPGSVPKSVCIEQIIRHITILGLEQFSKEIHDDNIKAIAEHTRDIKSPSDKKKKDSSGSTSTSGLGSAKESFGDTPSKELTKSQELKRAKVNGKNIEKEKSPRRNNGRKKS